jgi:hypothetical protein
MPDSFGHEWVRRADFTFFCERCKAEAAPIEGKTAGKEKCPYADGAAKGCYKNDPMGNGCKDSWWVGGNYGHPVCKNPLHRFEVMSAEQASNIKGGMA